MPKESPTLTHRDLCDIGARWCKRSASQNGHGCNIAIVEGCAIGENADAIGFRHSTYDGGSVLIEVKVSRQDFLADKGKPHRANPSTGMGKWRYYLCPEGIIDISDLPPKWGLIHVTPGGRLKVIAGAMAGKVTRKEREQLMAEYAFPEYNIINEQTLLIKNIARFDDFDDMLNLQREANRHASKSMQLQMDMNDLRGRLSTIQSGYNTKLKENLSLKLQLQKAGIAPLDNIDSYDTHNEIEELLSYKHRLELYSRNSDEHAEMIAFVGSEIDRIYERQAAYLNDSLRMRFKVDIPPALLVQINKDMDASYDISALSEANKAVAVERKLFIQDGESNLYKLNPILKSMVSAYIYQVKTK